MTKRTTDEWQTLLDGVVEGPWEARQDGHDPVWTLGRLGDNPARITGDGYGEGNARLLAAAPEAVAEVVRLRKALEQQLAYIAEELEAEGVETHDDIEGTWPSMQRYGELSEVIAQRDFLTRILEGHTNE